MAEVIPLRPLLALTLFIGFLASSTCATKAPTKAPTDLPTSEPTPIPSAAPTTAPSKTPTGSPTISCPSLDWSVFVDADDVPHCLLELPGGRHSAKGCTTACNEKAANFGGQDASLACIRSEAMMEWVNEADVGDDDRDTWIGLYWANPQNEGASDEWKWTSGCSSSYRFWKSGQPDDWRKKEDCVHFGSGRRRRSLWSFSWGTWKWNDADCSLNKACLCEWPAQTSSEFITWYDKLFDDDKKDDDKGKKDWDGKTKGGRKGGLLALFIYLGCRVVFEALTICVLRKTDPDAKNDPVPYWPRFFGPMATIGHYTRGDGGDFILALLFGFLFTLTCWDKDKPPAASRAVDYMFTGDQQLQRTGSQPMMVMMMPMPMPLPQQPLPQPLPQPGPLQVQAVPGSVRAAPQVVAVSDPAAAQQQPGTAVHTAASMHGKGTRAAIIPQHLLAEDELQGIPLARHEEGPACDKCGAVLPDPAATFCSRCGERISRPVASVAQAGGGGADEEAGGGGDSSAVVTL